MNPLPRLSGSNQPLIRRIIFYGAFCALVAGVVGLGLYGWHANKVRSNEFLTARIVGETRNRGDHLNTERQLNDLRQAIMSSALSADEKKHLLTISSSARPFNFLSIAPINQALPKDLPFLVDQFLRVNKEAVAEDKRGMALLAAAIASTPEQVRTP